MFSSLLLFIVLDSSMATDQDTLRRAFKNVKCSDDTVLAQLGAAADTHGLTARDVAGQLQAWLVNE